MLRFVQYEHVGLLNGYALHRLLCGFDEQDENCEEAQPEERATAPSINLRTTRKLSLKSQTCDNHSFRFSPRIAGHYQLSIQSEATYNSFEDRRLGLRRFFRRHFRAQTHTPAQNQEYQAGAGHPLYNYVCDFPALDLIREFAEPNPKATDGVVTNFLGVRIEPRVMSSILEPLAGKVEPIPDPGNWHADIAEWAATLLSVKEASGTYRIIELGCGWGCWLNNMGFVAKKRGLSVDLIGIEGDSSHLENAERTFQLNGFNPSEYRLVNGVAASKEGIALFPKYEEAHENWGAEPIFYPDEKVLAESRAKGDYTELNCYTLETLSNGEAVDLLHIDIQGSELDFVQSNFDGIENLVKRVFIGTHSRYLEGALQEFFLTKGWTLEMDRPVIHRLIEGRPQIEIDGVLQFKNPNHDKLPLH